MREMNGNSRWNPVRFLISGLLITFAVSVLGLTSCFHLFRAGIPLTPPGKVFGTAGTASLGVGRNVPGFNFNGETMPTSAPQAAGNTYAAIVENEFLEVAKKPLSTFSIDVDTASYSNMRQFLNEDKLPPADAVRLEEMINYFTYDYPQPESTLPVSIPTDVAECPWSKGNRLVRIGLKGREVDTINMPPRNLVFLIDVSGSMDAPNRLPLVKTAMDMMLEQLTAKDRVAIVTYADTAELRLPSTPGNRQRQIRRALQSLTAGGSTNGSDGILQAYRVAKENFIAGGVNRVILASDGDFNAGMTSQEELLKLIEEKRKSGIYLTVLGFGMGNLRDATMEQLADHGNGHYAYIDSRKEAQRVFVEQGMALNTIAKDVRIQVEFNPKQVASYRLLGYENRLMAAQDFNDDSKDAGDIGAGHTVTALYEIAPAGLAANVPGIDPLKYQQPAFKPTAAADSGELLTVKLRYKEPDSQSSKRITLPVHNFSRKFAEAPTDFRFAAAVAAFGMLLRDSKHKGDVTFAQVREIAQSAKGRNAQGHRTEFVQLVEKAERLMSAAPMTYTRIHGGIGP